MNRRLVWTLAVVLVAAVGCGNPINALSGSDPGKDYCTTLSSDRQAFASMLGADSPAGLVDHLPMLQALARQAPDDLTAQWQTFVGAVEGLRAALAAAHVAPSAYHHGTPPPGVDPAHLRTIRQAADQLSSEVTVSAASDIEQQARDVCKINLGM